MRILVVIDGRILRGHDRDDFGLGYALDTLRERFAWWVLLEVDVCSRREGFRFTKSGFDIDDFDQVWLFGDNPGGVADDANVSDDIIDLPEYSPLSPGELKVLADWMDNGGGVFATGDHTLLGASMCSRIPRVRTMRKWTHAQGVPSRSDEDRIMTLQHLPEGDEIAWEGDQFPQRIYPVYRRGPFPFFEAIPHPLLCGRDGVIDHFPDHMHEGAVVEDDEVEMNLPLDIPGFAGVEYPMVPDVVKSKSAVGGPEPFGNRPRPQVIAHGWTTQTEADPRRFALIGVYDGEPAKVGRVVVDSTWHHWFSMNLVGFIDSAPAYYRGMQDYYRNIALWLSTPQQRASMLIAATWGVLVGKQPGAFSKVMSIWEFGERGLDVIGRTAPQCIVSELVGTVVGAKMRLDTRREPRSRRSRVLRPPATMVNQAIVGGIAAELFDLSRHYMMSRAHGGDILVDEDAIWHRGLAGIAAGRGALTAAVAESVSELAVLRDALTNQVGNGDIADMTKPKRRKVMMNNLNAANHYVLEGVISGTVDTTSGTGTPSVALKFKGAGVPDAKLGDSIAGLQVTALLGARPDIDSQTLVMSLPLVNVTDTPVPFVGVALVVTTRTSVGGPALVSGVVHSYEIHPVAGTASVVEF